SRYYFLILQNPSFSICSTCSRMNSLQCFVSHQIQAVAILFIAYLYVQQNFCAICLETLSTSSSGIDNCDRPAIFTAQCSHSFHFLCIASNIRHGNVTCPICRAQWSQLPRDLKVPPLLHNQSDPILRILDDNIATSRVNRRSSIRATRYNDDDPVEPYTLTEHVDPCLRFALIPSPVAAHHHALGHYPCGRMMPPQQHCQYSYSGSSMVSPPQIASPSVQRRAYLSVSLAPQPAMDLVLVASPNGPHLRLLKQAVALVVFSMRAIDRLAIVTNATTATRAFPLRRMSSHGKRMALQVIEHLCSVGGIDPVGALQKGLKILEDRAHQNPSNCILHLSDHPIRSYAGVDMNRASIPVHQFHVGLGFGVQNSFVMHEFEELLARLLGGVIGDTHLRIGEHGGVVRLGELRGGEERRIPLDLVADCGFILVGYSYLEGGREDRSRTGEVAVGFEEKSDSRYCGGRDMGTSIGGERRSSCCAESWDHLDPFMARRWAKHFNVYRS
uniref:RING-type domain-containing protein n=1 Tax=Aegilops tauschii subsp. strangulata TaxID=200361 RepID=A0A453KKX9_AEGTS